jgi:hypothetical protein
MKMCNLKKSNFFCVFLNSFHDHDPIWKYDLLEENNLPFLFHNLWYMDVSFIYLHLSLKEIDCL